jgi:hypothetical protein
MSHFIIHEYKGYRIQFDKHTNKYVTEEIDSKSVTWMNHSTYEKAKAYVDSQQEK